MEYRVSILGHRSRHIARPECKDINLVLKLILKGLREIIVKALSGSIVGAASKVDHSRNRTQVDDARSLLPFQSLLEEKSREYRDG